jgi:hypothetical protein
MADKWIRLLFETCEAGVSSAVAPELLPDNQVAWGMNVDTRGGKAATRPNLRNLGNLPPGLIQGCEFFGIQSGMLVASIAGNLYRIRIGVRSITIEQIPLSFRNSSLIKQVWMTQTVETLVIQDGQSDAILYNGSVAVRAAGDQVPRGRQMAYGNGRLWVAVNANEVLAGDIRTEAAGSELYFTEGTYLQGGGKLFFSSPITGMGFIPTTGQADYGVLFVYGARETNAIRADITKRDDWAQVPGFVSAILRSVGSASQWSLVPVNQDLYWRDSNGGIRSIRNALADEAGPGSAPVSREVSRLTDFDSQQLLPFCSGVYFDNRLLLTSSPFLMPNGGVGWHDLISLDFAPLSTMGGKSQPAYNGKWNGLTFVKLVGGEFAGKNRSFALTTDADGVNQLWEFDSKERADIGLVCTDGTADAFENPIRCYLEYPLRNFGESKRRKILKRCDVWLSSINGEVDLKVYWRADNSIKWLLWDEVSVCAKTTDSSTVTPHVWKNLRNQERPQIKTFTIPDHINEVVKYAAQIGFEFQIRLVWTGRAKIHRVMVYGELRDDPNYVDRSGQEPECVENDITGNQIVYDIPTDGCPPFIITYENGQYTVTPGGNFGMGNDTEDPVEWEFEICNNGPTDLEDVSIGILSLCTDKFVVTIPPPQTIPVGECGSFTITFYPMVLCPPGTEGNGQINVNTGDNSIFTFTVDDETHQYPPEITEQPVDTCVSVDGAAEFTLTAVHGPLEYDWFIKTGSTWVELVDGSVYSGVNTSTLSIDPAGASLNGKIYRCRVRNPDSFIYSDEVTLQVGDCPSACDCALFIPPGAPPYADYATAETAIEDQANCYGYAELVGGSITSFTANVSVANALALSLTGNPLSDPTDAAMVWVSVTHGGGTLNLSSSSDEGTDSVMVVVYNCDLTEVVFTDSGLGPFSPTLPEGTYVILFYTTSEGSGGTSVFSFSASSSLLVPNPVIALWDDSGTTRQLEACPRTLLPLFTECNDALYSDHSSASAVFSDPAVVSNCIAYQENSPAPAPTFDATFDGSSLVLADSFSFSSVRTGNFYVSVNLAAGETLSFNVAGGATMDIGIRSYDCDQIDIGSSVSSFTSVPLPYTGKYYIYCVAYAPGGSPNISISITSSGAFTVNPIQALYNVGLSCPGRLDCS